MEVLGLLIILGLGALKALHLGLLWLCTWNILLKMLLVITVPVFFHVFTDGEVWSPSTLLCFWCCCCTGGYLFLGLQLYFMGGFDVVIVVGVERDWSVLLNLKRFPEIFPASGHGVPVQVGMFLSGGGCCLKYLLVKAFDYLNLLEHWELLQVVVWLHCWSWI